jgi:GTP cyclohydrolase I
MNNQVTTKVKNVLNGFTDHEIGEDHLFTGLETPMKKDAFKLTDEEKKSKISNLFEEIMDVMGLDLKDDSLKGTPDRVAKMYIDEIFSGLNPANKPKVALFDNKYQYNQMLVEKEITFYSNCEHHFVPIIGRAHIAYISSGKVIGLSKLNRIVQYYAKRPQVQERLTNQIAEELKFILGTDDVAVIIENPASVLTLPELSISPIPVPLASLVNDVSAFQFHAT